MRKKRSTHKHPAERESRRLKGHPEEWYAEGSFGIGGLNRRLAGNAFCIAVGRASRFIPVKGFNETGFLSGEQRWYRVNTPFAVGTAEGFLYVAGKGPDGWPRRARQALFLTGARLRPFMRRRRRRE